MDVWTRFFTARFKAHHERIDEIARAAPSREYSQAVQFLVHSKSPLIAWVGYDVHAKKAFLLSETVRRRLPKWAVPLPTA